MALKKWFLIGCLSFLIVGCFHEEELRKELFNVNTRLLTLENELQDKQQANSRQYVSASSRTGQLEDELRKIHGDIDRLQTGIQRGELPGQSASEPSVAKQIAEIKERLKQFDAEKLKSIEERVLAVEKAQIDILASLEKAEKSEKSDKKKNKKEKGSTLKSLEQDFQAKRYKSLVETIPSLLEKPGKDNDMLRYYYSESLFKIGNMREAAVSFGELLKKESLGHINPKVRLRMGDCFRNLGDKKTAVAHYKLLVDKYPDSSEAEVAKKLIKKIE